MGKHRNRSILPLSFPRSRILKPDLDYAAFETGLGGYFLESLPRRTVILK